MAALSFIDAVFTQFMPQAWKLGIGIYRAGGVVKFSNYNELVSVKVRAGIGEIYEARLKLHSQGKCVQWMECTCQANRRHNEKCAHLAAFCIFIDQEKKEVIERFNMEAGNSDRYIFGERYGRPADSDIDPILPIVTNKKSEKTDNSANNSAPPTFEPPIWMRDTSQVISVDISNTEALLLLTAQVKDKKPITYCLGIDDAVKALQDPEILEKASPKLIQMQTKGHTAQRIFTAELTDKRAIKVTRNIVIKSPNSPAITTPIEKLIAAHIGKSGLFLKEYGFIPFTDGLSHLQVPKWQEYPTVAFLENDIAASLCDTQFQRLLDTAHVELSPELSALQVVNVIKFDELTLKSDKYGQIIVEANLINNGNLLSIIKARAEGKKYLSTKSGWIKLSENLDWLKDKLQADGNIKLSSLEFIKFREQFAEASEIKSQDPVIERLKAGLISTNEIEIPSLDETNLTLRQYQYDGVKWLWWLFQNRLSGLLADEMGLGKTHQAMGLLALIAKKDPNAISLVICPTSVIDHWIDKINRFAPNLDPICYHGAGRKMEYLQNDSNKHRIIITSYGIMLRDADMFSHINWSVIILDEAHLVKNQTTRTYRAACKIPSKMRLCLTGTPLENDLMELKNLFDYILPNYLGSDAEFKRKYVTDNKSNTLSDLDLHRIIHPFKMRRNKSEVLKELPDKVEDLRYCHLNREQHKLYKEALALKGAPLLETLNHHSENIPYIHIFSIITLLKQICDDPALVDSRYENVGSGKLDLLDEIINEAVASKQKVVVFSQYAKMINRLSARLTAQKIGHCVLTGATQKRGEVVRDFQENPNKQVFLGSLLAGGSGIDLTAANIVIHFDRWWNAAKENQATDRVHRIGQTQNVQIYKLITRGSLEERINDIIAKKRIVFERFVEQDTEVFKHLSREDLLNLLKPPDEASVIDDKENNNLPEFVNFMEEVSIPL